jgi:hypothetical protein
MKTLTRTEIQNKIITYLGKKGIIITISENDELTWNYKQHYTVFSVRLYLEKKNYSDQQPNLIRYYPSERIKGFSRRRTSVNSGFCLKIYRDLMLIKPKFDEIAEKIKLKEDVKIRYCTELELHYKKLYKYVGISTSKYENIVNIDMSCSNSNSSVYYSITYKDNKYYLNRKTEHFDSPLETIID